MTTINPIWAEGNAKRWLRHDWRAWVKPEAHHLYEPLEQKRALRFDEVARQRAADAAAIAAAKREQEALEQELLELRRDLATLKLDLVLQQFQQKYRPDQPRVPAGSSSGGQWVSDEVGGGAQESRQEGQSDTRVISDETPDNEWKPGAQFAQIRRSRGPILINGRWVQPTPAQEALLQGLEVRLDSALQRVRTILPGWRPAEGSYNTINGSIENLRAQAEQAEARIAEFQDKGLLPGRFAAEWVPARGPERSYTIEEREEVARIFAERGCNTCGTREAGTPSGNPVLDHHPPSALNSRQLPQRLYPQCLTCSLTQGGWVRSLMRQR
jgi:hypothetical protein